MKILFDTNVVTDVLLNREPFATSVITSKPAIRDHFKTGQRNYSGQEEFYRIFTELSK
jgi:hypothetical protein